MLKNRCSIRKTKKCSLLGKSCNPNTGRCVKKTIKPELYMLTVPDLKLLCKEKGLSGYSKLTKDRIILLLGGKVKPIKPVTPTRAPPPSRRKIINMAVKKDDVIKQLRGYYGDLDKYVEKIDAKLPEVPHSRDISNPLFVNIKHIDMHELEPVDFIPEQKNDIVQIFLYNGDFYMRATFGWKGKMADKMFEGKFFRRTRLPPVLCATHTTHADLANVYWNRPYNILRTPKDIPDNEGVIGCLNTTLAMKNGLEFWSKESDRHWVEKMGRQFYTAYCFEIDLKYELGNFKYTDAYATDEYIKENFKDAINTYKKFLPEDKAIEQVKKLIVTIEN